MTQSQIEWLLIIILLSILGIWAAIPLPAIAAGSSIQVAAAADDAYEYQDSGFVSWQDDQITIDAGTFAAARFPLAVATGTTAQSATITLTANGSTLACSHMPIRLEAADTAQDYEYGPTIWSRQYTTNAIVATVPPLASDGSTWTSPNIATLVNEIIGRPGWIPGHYIAVMLGPCAGSTEITELHSYDTDPDAAPQLTIDWQEPTGIELSGYGINLPSGRVATVSRLITAGDQLITQLLIAIATILTFRLILRIIDGSRASS